jgi:hypothetical protein
MGASRAPHLFPQQRERAQVVLLRDHNRAWLQHPWVDGRRREAAVALVERRRAAHVARAALRTDAYEPLRRRARRRRLPPLLALLLLLLLLLLATAFNLHRLGPPARAGLASYRRRPCPLLFLSLR